MSIARDALIAMTNSAARIRTPIVTATTVVSGVIVVVIIVMRINVMAAIAMMIPVRVTVIRMAIIAVVVDIQAVGVPANGECCGHTPEESVIERIA